MNTKRLIRTILFALPVILSGCAADDSSTGGKEISKITIDSASIQTAYNQSKNDVVVIEPQISQTMENKTLSYEWEINHKTYSTDRVLRYTCNELGTFEGRLIVSNEDGKAFFPFKIHVNTPYEEGLVIISNDPDGKSMISFMLHHTDDTPDTFTEGDVFSINNPEVPFAPNVSEVVQSNGNLIVACKGSEQTGEPASIYYLQEKTMDIENYVTVPEYPDFKPIRMMVCSVAFGGASYPILCENGKVYEFASTEGAVVTSTKFPSTYDTKSAVFYDDGTGGNYNIFLWDTEMQIPVTMFNGYGGYYCIADYSQKENKSAVNMLTNMFAMYNDQPVAMFIPRFTKAQLQRETPQIYIITSSSNQLRRTAMNKGVWVYDSNSGSSKFSVTERFGSIGQQGSVPFEPGMPMIASQTNKRLFYAMGNKIYQWFYTQNSLTQATVFTEVGNSGTVVKSLELSADQKTLYVAAYDPNETGLNGSCYIIEINQTTSTEEVYAGEITAHEHVCYQPVKIMYKQK